MTKFKEKLKTLAYYTKKYFREALLTLLNRGSYRFKKPLEMEVWKIVWTDDMNWDICTHSVWCMHHGSIESFYGGYPEIRHIDRTRDLIRLLWAYVIRA